MKKLCLFAIGDNADSTGEYNCSSDALSNSDLCLYHAMKMDVERMEREQGYEFSVQILGGGNERRVVHYDDAEGPPVVFR